MDEQLAIMRVEALIKLLNVCPKCVNGFVSDSPFRKANQKASMPAVASVTNTWDLYLTEKCSNSTCDFSQSLPNPNYKAPIAAKKEGKNDSDQEMYGNDLFG